MSDLHSFQSDPAWLRIPAGRRSTALRRLEALLEYEKISQPGVEDAKRAAEKAGISLRLFYFLLRIWRSPNGRSIWTLLPYAGRPASGRSQLDVEVQDVLHRLIRGALAQGKRSERQILDAILKEWPASGLKLPSHQTVRIHIQSAGGIELLEKGSFRLNTAPAPQEKAETATQHGEVLVIDHCAAAAFIATKPPRRATLTLAIDLHSATIAGFAIGIGLPTPNLVLAALDDVQSRNADNPGEEIIPRLVLASTNGSQWRELFELLGSRGLEATVRWGSRLHFGGPTKRLIGPRIADLAIMPRKAHSSSGDTEDFDPSQHALLTPDEARLVVVDAVNKLNMERLPEREILNRIRIRK